MESKLNGGRKQTEGQINITGGTIKPFGPHDVFDFGDTFDIEKLALKALAELIGSSDLESFSGEDSHARQNRFGLKLILDLYLEKNERMVEGLRERASNSPEYIIDAARGLCEFHGQQGSIPPVLFERALEALHDLEALVKQFGSEVYPEAKILGAQLRRLIHGGNNDGSHADSRTGTDG